MGSFGFGTLICLLALLLLPKFYAAKISFLPVLAVDPHHETSTSNTVVTLSILSGKSTARPISVLKSRVIKEEIIKKLKLMKVYKTETMIEATEILDERTKIETTVEGAISIEVSDRSPQRAADIANEYGNQLCNAQQQYQFVPLKVLDTPTPPVEPIRPRKSILVLWTVVLTLFLDLIVLFSHKFIIDLKEQSPDEFEKL